MPVGTMRDKMRCRIVRGGMLVMLVCAAIGFCGCGREGLQRVTPEEGEVLVRNETGIPMAVSWTDEQLGEQDRVVEAGEELSLFEAALAGGTEISVYVEALGTPRPHAEVPITVDGDVTLRILSFGPWGKQRLEYRVERRSGPTGGGGGAAQRRDGRISLLNQTSVSLRATYFDETEGAVERVIPAGERREVSAGVLKGGTKVKLIVEREGGGTRVQEIEIVVDGNVLIRVTGFGARYGFEYEITAG